MILDYMRTSEGGTIIIPPFHTGHLGFIPGTEVSVALLAPHGSHEGHCEILVTPFAPNFSTLCRLTCTMADHPGVVNRLIEAVASLGINIVKQESSAVNSLDHHVVELVLDWRTSRLNADAEPEEVVSKFDERLAYRLPIHLHRYLLLYQAVMCRCGDVIVINNDFNAPLPAITITPFSDTGEWLDPVNVRIERVLDQPDGKDTEDRVDPARSGPAGTDVGRIGEPSVGRLVARQRGAARVYFDIPEKLLARIRHMTRFEKDEPLPYILSSETSSRSLRLFFPKKRVVSRIIHLAFTHMDVPGALSAITKVLADRKFNILTGLLRKKTGSTSGYEVILEYMDEKDPPPQRSDGGQLLAWISTRLADGDDASLAELNHFQVSISLPEYPKASQHFDPVPVRSKSSVQAGEKILPVSPQLLENCINRVRSALELEDKPEQRAWRLNFLESIRMVIERKPSLFLSYPRSAKEHAKMLKKAISETFGDKLRVDEYQDPDFEIIVSRVLAKIQQCDFFLGIWHHDWGDGHKEPGISPWMPFEYGIAVSAKKKAIIIRSEDLPDSIWKRIEPAKAHPAYNDLQFAEKTVPMVIKYIQTHWSPTGVSIMESYPAAQRSASA